jgi:hypothetical protein
MNGRIAKRLRREVPEGTYNGLYMEPVKNLFGAKSGMRLLNPFSRALRALKRAYYERR